MTLVKTSMLNGIAVVVKVASALLLNKILAVYVGPAGYAVIGQFQNAVSIIANLAGGLVATGVTKATAQHFDDTEKQHAVWQTALRFSLCASIVAGIFLLIIGNSLAQWMLHREDMSSVFTWLAVALPAIAANNILLAIINGKKEVGIYVAANINASLISLLIVGLLAYFLGLYGALVAFIINPAIVLITTAAIVTKREWFKAKFLWGKINMPAMRELSGFGLMGLISALAAPLTYMMIRSHLVSVLGLNAAGYWQASWKISEIYLMLVTTTLSLYYLPRLAEIKTANELRSELLKVYKFVLPATIFGAIAIYCLKDLIIDTLFSSDFDPMKDLLMWQLTGDVIKISSWVLSFVMLGRAMVKAFVVTEIVFSLLFYFLTTQFIVHAGLVGVSISYAINYLFYWIVMVILVKIELKKMGAKGTYA